MLFPVNICLTFARNNKDFLYPISCKSVRSKLGWCDNKSRLALYLDKFVSVLQCVYNSLFLESGSASKKKRYTQIENTQVHDLKVYINKKQSSMWKQNQVAHYSSVNTFTNSIQHYYLLALSPNQESKKSQNHQMELSLQCEACRILNNLCKRLQECCQISTVDNPVISSNIHLEMVGLTRLNS